MPRPAFRRVSERWKNLAISTIRRARQVVGPASVSSSEKRDIAKKAITSTRADKTLTNRRRRSAANIQEKFTELDRVRSDTHEGRSRRAKLVYAISHAEAAAKVQHVDRNQQVRRNYTYYAQQRAAEKAIDALPLSKSVRDDALKGILGGLHHIPIPTKYYGNVVRFNQTNPVENFAEMRRYAVAVLKIYLPAWAARLFLVRYYSFFRSLTTRGVRK